MKKFLKTTILGGVTVVLPVVLLAALFTWLYKFVTTLIAPLTKILLTHLSLPKIFADVLVVVVILAVCFFVGIFVRTNLGTWIYQSIENRLLKNMPGYTLIKETVLQLMGTGKSPFSSVALARLFGNETLVTVFVTDEHDSGAVTVFMPTGPNPTSGNIYHVKREDVYYVDVPVEDAMRSIIGCGTGSKNLMHGYVKSVMKQQTDENSKSG